jgi:hypothetical protein
MSFNRTRCPITLKLHMTDYLIRSDHLPRIPLQRCQTLSESPFLNPADMLRLRGLTLLCVASSILGLATAQNDTRPVSNELFNSLEELSRLVDISYCVGTTGVQKPFQCLSHCTEFPNLELIEVSTSPTTPENSVLKPHA